MRKFKLVVTTVCLFALAAPARADVSNVPSFQTTKGQLRVGAFFVNQVNTKLRINSTRGPLGTYLDASEDLGMENENVVPRVNFSYRFRKKHRIDLGWINIERSGTKVLDKTIEFGDKTFPIYAEAESYLNTEIFKLKYGYVFFDHPDASLGIGAGLHFTNIGIGISTSDTPEPIKEDVGGLAPLPMLGFTVTYRIKPKLIFAARVDQFFLSYNAYAGSLIDANLVFEYRAFKKVGFGLGWNHMALSLEMNDGNLVGDFENAYNGLLFYTAAYF